MSKSIATREELRALIADTVATWHGDHADRRPMAEALIEALTPHLSMAPMAVDPEMARIGELIRTQDNRCTDQPIFAVMEKRAMCADEDYDYDRIEWRLSNHDYELATDTQARRLEALYQNGRDTPDGWQRNAIKDIDVFVTACFTEQGCKDFLARDGHNHRQPFIYAFGSYRNAEYQALRNWLKGLPIPEVKP